jgi:hypothetical protein
MRLPTLPDNPEKKRRAGGDLAESRISYRTLRSSDPDNAPAQR